MGHLWWVFQRLRVILAQALLPLVPFQRPRNAAAQCGLPIQPELVNLPRAPQARGACSAFPDGKGPQEWVLL